MADGEPATAAAMTFLERCTKALERARASLMPGCREMTRRSSDALEREPGLFDRIGARIHLAMCSACRRYRTQLNLLHRTARRWRPENGSPKRLSPEAKERLKAALKKHVDEGDCDHDHG
jgi:hypothetical protein